MISLRDEITCLHCWAKFAPEDVFWVSEHRELRGDPLLGEEAQLRFLATRFDLSGNALDMKGQTCRDIACPKCHLTLPRALLEREPLFVSVLGTPSCGKSFYLGALVATLRRELPSSFCLGFSDADAFGNQILVGYEERMFLSEAPDTPVALGALIAKTALQGDLYQTVRHGEQTVAYSRPFSFLLEPIDKHPNCSKAEALRRIVCLYDNAGEHYLPGQDKASSPGTRHLSESSFLVFLFDPTQDPRWHAAMRQDGVAQEMPRTQHAGRQEAVLSEAASRVRKLLNLPDGAKLQRPLFVVLNKLDLWSGLLAREHLDPPIVKLGNGMRALDVDRIKGTSMVLKHLLLTHLPELVYTAESFCSEVHYLAASALGTRPELREEKQGSETKTVGYIRPADIRPMGVTIPFLLGLRQATQGLVAVSANGRSASASNRAKERR